MAREKADKGDTQSQKSTQKGGVDDDEDQVSHHFGVGGSESMEPDILL